MNSKAIRRSLQNEQEGICDIQHVGKTTLIANGVLCNRGIKEIVRVIDSNNTTRKTCKHKFKSKANLIDLSVQK